MNEPHWTQVLSALLAPTIALFGAWLAYKQWRSSQNKLKMELFEKRYSIYQASKNFIMIIMRSNKDNDEELFKFRAGTSEAKWLLNDEIAAYLDKKIWEDAIDLQTLRAELEDVPVGKERSANIKNQRVIKERLEAQVKVLDEKFTPFLKLGH